MEQIANTTKKHSFVVLNETNNTLSTTLTAPVCYYRANGAASAVLFTPTISTYNANTQSFTVSIDSAIATTIGDTLEIFIKGTEGSAHLIIEIITSPLNIITTEMPISALQMPYGKFGRMLLNIYKNRFN
jgi:hypothetical protein